LDRLQLVDAADQSALARPAGAADNHDLSDLHGQINVLEDVEGTEPFVDTTKLDHERTPSPIENRQPTMENWESALSIIPWPWIA
jgi:hypothetical protein